MPIDANIPLQVKTPDPMQAISSMLNVQNTMQSMRARDLSMVNQSQQNQQGAIDLQERKAMQEVMRDPRHRNQDGSVNYNTLVPASLNVAPTSAMKFIGQVAEAEKQSIAAKSAIMNLDMDKKTQLGQIAKTLIGQPLNTVNDGLDAAGNQSRELGTSIPWIKQQIKTAYDTGGGQPAVNALLKRIVDGTQTPPIQQTMNTPTVATVNDNQQTQGINIKPGVDGMPVGSVVPGTGAILQPPPTTPTMGGPNGITPGIIGPKSGPAPGQLGQVDPASQDQVGRAQSDINALTRELSIQKNPDIRFILQNELKKSQSELQQLTQQPIAQQKPASGFIQTGLPIGQEANLKDNVDAMNTHFAKISGVASDAQLGLSLVSSIKSLANNAITGTLQGRTSYVNGLLNSVHLGDKITGDLQKDTDLLEKYLSQLNLSTPAATNAAREIITAARPHGTMIKGALTEAADQIGSVINANYAVRNHLSGYKYANGGKGDPVGYDAEKRNIEGIADPRIFQMQGKSKDEIAAYMKPLSAFDQKELARKSRLLHEMGIIK